MVTPYRLAADGTRQPDLPVCGPCHTSDDPCCLKPKGWRGRATGPCFPLWRLACRTHGGSFTLYPPGHVPHGRKALAPVAPDGEELYDPLNEGWFDGYFEAALDAAEGRAWPKESEEGSDKGRFITQTRQLRRLAILVGVAPAQERIRREQVVTCLEIEGLWVHEGLLQLRAGDGYRELGQAVKGVRDAVMAKSRAYERLIAAGHSADLWSRPHLWDKATGQFRILGLPPP